MATVSGRRAKSQSNSWKTAQKLVELSDDIGTKTIARFFLGDHPEHKSALLEAGISYKDMPTLRKSHRVRAIVEEFQQAVEQGLYVDRFQKIKTNRNNRNKLDRNKLDRNKLDLNKGEELEPLLLQENTLIGDSRNDIRYEYFNPTYAELLALSNLAKEFGGLAEVQKTLDILEDLVN